jgi:hypothetical protein
MKPSLAFFLAVMVPFLFFFSRAYAEDDYINKSYIDSTIQRVFFNLNAATDVSGMGMKMDDAITFAKQAAQRLKNIANESPNKKYILWKVGEIESQIYLEESGMLLEKNQKRQKLINDLVAPFNAEIGAKRPDFARLVSLHNQALSIDRAKAYEFGVALEARKKNIRREAAASLENALTEGDYELARREAVFLKTNQEPLGMSLAQYSMLAAKVQAKVTVNSEREFIALDVNAIEALLLKNSFSEARTALSVAENRVDGLKDMVMKTEWDRYYFKTKRLRESLEHKEDSLVRINLAILGDQGVVAADDYLENVLKKLGVFHEKTSKMGLAILEKAMASRKLQDTAVVKQLASIPRPAMDDSCSMFFDLMSAAKKKAQEKADSAKTATEGNVRHTHSEEVRLANMRVSMELRKKREEELKVANTTKANKLMIEIYTLLEKKEVQKAWEEYNDHQPLLARYIPVAEFSLLDSLVNAKHTAMGKKR